MLRRRWFTSREAYHPCPAPVYRGCLVEGYFLMRMRKLVGFGLTRTFGNWIVTRYCEAAFDAKPAFSGLTN
ncbi:MAG: hypothetical protein ACRC2T_18880 [Thermoguttaceae bacterium]